MQLPHRRCLNQPDALPERKPPRPRHSRRVLHKLPLQGIPAQFQIRAFIGPQLVVVGSREDCNNLLNVYNIYYHIRNVYREQCEWALTAPVCCIVSLICTDIGTSNFIKVYRQSVRNKNKLI